MGIVAKLRFKASNLYHFRGKGDPEDVVPFLNRHPDLFKTGRSWTFKNTTCGIILDVPQRELEVYYPRFGGFDKRKFEEELAKYGWS